MKKIQTAQHFECINNIEPYECERCPTFQTHYLANLRYHYKNISDEVEGMKYGCLICDFVTYSSLFVLRHDCFFLKDEKKAINQSINGVLRKKLKIKLCSPKKDKLVPWLLQQRKKTQSPNNERLHKCEYCAYTGTQKEHLRRHIIMRHLLEDQIEWFNCEYCTSKFKLKHHLTRHMHCHSDPAVIKWFKCDKCNSKFKLEEYLKRHIKSCYYKLEDVYLFKCQQCSSKYKENRHLTKHLKLCHAKPEDIQWFKCENCQFKTKYVSSLNKHIRNQHTDPDRIQWFECDGCHFKTKHRHSFKNHLQTRHSVADKNG